MTFETYSNFVKIVECGSITAASESLLIAQPALSTQLKNLEKTLGVQLIDRGSKRIKLTFAGEIFYKNAKILCSVNEGMLEDLNNYISGTEGVLKLSMPPSNPISLMETLFDGFVDKHPGVNFEIKEVLSSQVAENVRNGISEIGMIRTSVRNIEDFDVIPYSSEDMMAIVSNQHPLAKFESIKLEQLRDVPIATTDGVVPAIKEAFATLGCEPIFKIKTSIRRTALHWTSHYKNCVTILPCSEEEMLSRPDYKMLKISDYNFSAKRSFIIAKDRELSPIAAAFLSEIGVRK